MTVDSMQFLIGDDIEVEAGAYRGCTGKVVKVTKIQMKVLMESGVRHPLMEPVAGSIRRVKQDNARLVNRAVHSPRRFARVPPDTDILSLNAQAYATRQELREDAERLQRDIRGLITAINHLDLLDSMRASPSRSSTTTLGTADDGRAVGASRNHRRRRR